MAGTVNVEAAELCHCPNHDGTYIVKLRQSVTLTINLSVRRAIEPFHYQRDQWNESLSQGGPGKGAFKHANSLDFRHCGVSNMGRAIVEEIATLASLALFVGMVAIWAQVIATL